MSDNKGATFFSLTSSDSFQFDSLDPLISKAKNPPTEGQLLIAEQLGIDLTGKNPGSAAIAIAAENRRAAYKLIAEYNIQVGDNRILDAIRPCFVEIIGDPPKNFYAHSGTIVSVYAPAYSSKPGIRRWINPKRILQLWVESGLEK